jgi:virginiamycin B lyase
MPKTLFFALVLIAAGIPAQAQTTRPLPAGDGKDLVATACTTCHAVTLITGTGHTPADWKLLVERMVAAGAEVPKDQIPVVTAYLTKSFPEGNVPKAVLIPGPVKVTFKEWTAPTIGSRPHDPLAAHDGTIWYSGQYANVLGRINPNTGDIKEFRPPTKGSGPHGLVEDKDGKIWFTANSKGYIGKLDPASGQVTEYKLPEAARDPHTPLFDRDGTLWFTVQGANMVGRLDPRTGETKLTNVPTPKANPYGMVLTSQGVPYFDEFGTNALASIDPRTLAIREYPLPNPNARPRRIAITPDDVIYFTDYARGYLGRFDPKTGAIAEFASPSGPESRPYAITYFQGAMWYTESAAKPNTLVRFDLATQKFQTWPIPSGGGVVRNMMAMPDGSGIAMACSGANRIALALVTP